jgi:Bacterial PH domain
MKSYKAPWSISLIVMTSLASVICVGVSLDLARHGRALEALLPLAIVCGGLLFIIRGYTITGDAILVHRLFWSTRLPLLGLQSAEVAPDIMRGGFRLWGNGGLFSFTGWFRNSALGVYRSFVTDPHRTVVLRYSTRRVVLSPSSPDEFVHEVVISRQAA